jgi:Domain of unknown function (DUF4476)
MKKNLLFAMLLLAITCTNLFAQQNFRKHHQGEHHNGGNHHQPNNNYPSTPPQQACGVAPSILKFNLENPYRTYVLVDGKNYGFLQNLYNGINLYPGEHTMQIIKKAKWGEMAYTLFNGNVCIKPNTIATASLNYYHGLVMSEMPMYTNQYSNDDDYYSPTPVICATDERTFCAFKSVVKNAWFDSDKQKMICNFLSKNYVNSNQVGQLLQLIDFESTRLVVAKEAYTKVIDKNNYYVVFNQFDFESSKRELSDFMARC